MALVSILHRIAGVILVFATPVAIYFLSLSLDSAEAYQQLWQSFDHILLRLTGALTLWALGHHVFAGLRLLIIDLYGQPVNGRQSAFWVLLISGMILLLAFLMVLL